MQLDARGHPHPGFIQASSWTETFRMCDPSSQSHSVPASSCDPSQGRPCLSQVEGRGQENRSRCEPVICFIFWKAHLPFGLTPLAPERLGTLEQSALSHCPVGQLMSRDQPPEIGVVTVCNKTEFTAFSLKL